ncbi:MAG TPA: helix-turn-helix transcriptional regulator [bacterium]|nr:helix-turn-helix transcriptional regulator [bacterium]
MVDSAQLYSQIGKEISKLRQSKNRTQTQLAKAVSLTRTSITNIEKGRQKILVHTLWDLAEELGIHPSKLLPKKILPTVSAVEVVDKATGISDYDKKWIKSIISKQENK